MVLVAEECCPVGGKLGRTTPDVLRCSSSSKLFGHDELQTSYFERKNSVSRSVLCPVEEKKRVMRSLPHRKHVERVLCFGKASVLIHGDVVPILISASLWFVGIVIGIFSIQLETDVHKTSGLRDVCWYNTVNPERCP